MNFILDLFLVRFNHRGLFYASSGKTAIHSIPLIFISLSHNYCLLVALVCFSISSQFSLTETYRTFLKWFYKAF